MNIQVAGLFVYPLKGCRGIALDSALVEGRGLRFDRRWMLARTDTGHFLSQRTHPQMARLSVAVDADGSLEITGDTGAVRVPFVPDAGLARREVTVWSFTGDALDCGDDAAFPLSEMMGLPVRLVRVPDDFSRRLKPEFATAPTDGTGFADGFPVLLASEASLADLNTRLAEPVPMSRFRANIVVRGDLSAWAEDDWHIVRIGDVAFVAAKPCERCAVTTINQETGAKTGAEPLATLATFRRAPQTGKVLFGENLVPWAADAGKTVSMGDAVTGQ